MRYLYICISLSLLWLVAGCSSEREAGGVGRVQLTIQWPARAAAGTRMIPAYAQSLTVGFYRYESASAPCVPLVTLNRPEGGGFSTFTSPPLPTGVPLYAVARAYAGADGSGQQLAGSQQPFTLTGTGTQSLQLTLESAINYLQVLPSAMLFTPGDTQALQYAAKDFNDAPLPVPADGWHFQSSNPNVCTVDAQGNVTAVANGLAFITVRHAESPSAINVLPVAVDDHTSSVHARWIRAGEGITFSTGAIAAGEGDLCYADSLITVNDDTITGYMNVNFNATTVAPALNYSPISAFVGYVFPPGQGLIFRVGQDTPHYYKAFITQSCRDAEGNLGKDLVVVQQIPGAE